MHAVRRRPDSFPVPPAGREEFAEGSAGRRRLGPTWAAPCADHPTGTLNRYRSGAELTSGETLL